jgi:hypothetical protein
MSKSHLTMTKNTLALDSVEGDVSTVAKDHGKKGTGAKKGGQGMASKDLLGMASSEVAAVAGPSHGDSGSDLSFWGKASASVPAVAASAKKSGTGA